MSYQVLARKWRPQTFDELAGQEHVLRALINALENNRLHHAYLFTGTRGVGKTTIARILARSLNCETGVSAKPCGTCSACSEITEGRFVDLIEVDAASRTKVEDTRELLENVQYRPTRGRFKIYLIDEVHMLSNHSFNALLKTLEEPPEHVKFLLATTDPQKLPITVLSRCLQFNLKKLTGARIHEYLEFVLGEEHVPFDSEALWHLARAAHGSMRDALSLTDQAISHGGGKLSEADVVGMLGTVDRQKLTELMDALSAMDGQRLLSIAAELEPYSPDYFSLVEELMAMFHQIAVRQTLADKSGDRPGEGLSQHGPEQERISAYAQAFSPEVTQLFYQMLLLGRRDLAVAPDLHTGFEMLLLRMLAYGPAVEGEELASAVADIEGESRPPSAIAAEESPPVKKSITEKDFPKEQSMPESESEPELRTASDDNVLQHRPNAEVSSSGSMGLQEVNHAFSDYRDGEPEIQHAQEFQEFEVQQGLQVESEPHGEAVANSSAGNSSMVSDERLATASSNELPAVPEDIGKLDSPGWLSLYQCLPLRGMLKSLSSHLVLASVDQSKLNFGLAEPGQAMFAESHVQKLAEVLSEHFGCTVEVVVQPGSGGLETPAQYADRCRAERLIEAEQSIMRSPLVSGLVAELQAQLVPGSVKLTDEP